MFGLETFATMVFLGVILVAGSIFERKLANMPNPRLGLILPLLAGVIAILLSIQNFLIAFHVSFSLPAFAAAVVIFIFYMVPSLVFSLIYLEERQEVKMRAEERKRRNMAARRQQLYRKGANLDRRYRS